MEKELLLQELMEKLSTGEVSREEISQRLGLAPTAQQAQSFALEKDETQHFTVTKMLYVLGAAIVVIGIVLFIVQIWDNLGSVGRIAITLGFGLMFALLGSMQLKKAAELSVGTVFHFIGGMLIPLGAVVTLAEMSLDDSIWSFAIAFISIFVFYMLLNTVHKNAILTFFAIANGTAAIYLVTGAILDPMLDNRAMETVFQYLTMALGGSYLLLARAFIGGWNEKLVGALNFFGVTGLLGAAFAQVFDSGFWELLYFVIVFGTLFVSVYMKSRIILVMSTIFLLAHVTYITSEYFADSLGWPVALVFLGFVFIGFGYASIMINKTYIAESK